MSQSPTFRQSWLVLLLFFALSALLRVAVVWPVLGAEVAPVWDEAGYFQMALGQHGALSNRLAGKPPEQADLDAAYGRGTWPPAHSLVLGFVFWLFGPTVAVARLTTVVLSALTTPLLYRLGGRLGGREVGLATACLHLLYPGFVGFAHLLWSENLFFLLLALGLDLALRVPESQTPTKAVGRGALAGLVLGLATLTRVSGAALLLVVCLWLVVHTWHSWRGLPACVAALAAGLVLMPWQLELNRREESFSLLSAANGYNLLLGQIEPEPGETGPGRKQRINRLIRAEVEAGGGSRDQAARRLAWQHIGEKPLAFFGRCLNRLPALFHGETHLVRHLYQVVYPPLRGGWALGIRVFLWAAYALLLALILFGVFAARHRLRHLGLLLALACAAMAPALPTVASSRIGMPVLVLLLPVAGLTVMDLWQQAARRKRFLLLLAVVLVIQGCRHWRFERGSSWYSPLQHDLGLPVREEESGEEGDEPEPRRPPLGETWLLRAQGSDCPEVMMESPSPEAGLSTGLPGSRPSAKLRWVLGREPVFVVRVEGQSLEEPLSVVLRCVDERETAGTVSLDISAGRSAWHQWRPTGIAGIDAYWWGGAEARPIPAVLLLP